MAPPLSPDALATLGRYRPPRALAPFVWEAVQRLRSERMRCRVGVLATAVLAAACGIGWGLSQTTQVQGLLAAMCITAMIGLGSLVGPATQRHLVDKARRMVEARFAPLTSKEAGIVLAFLHRHPEAAAMMSGWMQEIPSLRRYEFELFEPLFRVANAAVGHEEVTAVLTRYNPPAFSRRTRQGKSCMDSEHIRDGEPSSRGISTASGAIQPLLVLDAAALLDLQREGELHAPMLKALSQKVDFATAHTPCDEIRELCRAFTTGISEEVRVRRATVASRLAGCEGRSDASYRAISRRSHIPTAIVHSDADGIFRRIAQASLLGLLPPTPRIDAIVSMSAAWSEHDLMLARFAIEVLQRRPNDRRVSDALNRSYAGPALHEAAHSRA